MFSLPLFRLQLFPLSVPLFIIPRFGGIGYKLSPMHLRILRLKKIHVLRKMNLGTWKMNFMTCFHTTVMKFPVMVGLACQRFCCFI